MVYANYEYYLEKYFGTLPEDSFNSLVVKASREIDNNINLRLTKERVSNLSEGAQDSLSYTACALTDLMAKKEESGNVKFNSISIDGVSKSFKMLSTDEYIACKNDILKSLPDELTKYL